MDKELLQQIKEAEARVLADPTNSEHYMALLSCYLSEADLFADPKRIHYITEAIQRFPKALICHTPYVQIDPERSPNEYKQVETLWQGLLHESPSNIDIAKGLANFYSYKYPQQACEVLKKSIEMKPESHDLWFHLARYCLDKKERLSYLLNAEKYGSKQANLIVWITETAVDTGNFDIAQRYVQRLLALIQEAEALYGDKLQWRGHSKELYQKAYALMDKAEANKLVRNIGTNNFHQHYANTVLGQLALLRDDDIEAALHYLSVSCDVGHDCRLSSYGPSMKLAKDISTRGYWAETIEYLKCCQSFWSNPMVEEWISQLQKQQQPEWSRITSP